MTKQELALLKDFIHRTENLIITESSLQLWDKARIIVNRELKNKEFEECWPNLSIVSSEMIKKLK